MTTQTTPRSPVLASTWSSWTFALCGVAVLAVGIGFTPYLAKPAPLPSKGAATVLLIAGVTLTVGGLLRATRERPVWRRVLAGFALLVVTAVVVLVVSPAVAATHVPRPAVGTTPTSVGLNFADVQLQASDGVMLAAWYVPSGNGAAVVLLHGAGSTRSHVLDEATVLASAGYGVLMVDARGHGDSDGTAMDFGWAGDLDIAAATTFLADRPDVDDGRIGAVGLSMGGEEAIGAAATNPDLRAVVAEGATARMAHDEDWLSERYGPRGALQEQLEQAQDAITAMLAEVPRPVSLHDAVANASETSFLLITAGELPDESDAADYISSAATERVDVWTVPGAGHIGGLQTEPQDWQSRVIGFLDGQLLGATTETG